MSECKWFPVCPIKYFTEQGRLEEKWVIEYCHKNWLKCKRYQMEEAGEYHSDCMLPDGSIRKDLCD